MENIKNAIDLNMSEEIKRLICKLPDVLQCSIVSGKDNTIQEIHVLAGTGKNIKQLVRDIQSAVNAMFGIDIDYKIISIAQINLSDVKDSRIRIDSIAVKNIENSIEADVILIHEDKKYEGKSVKVKSRLNKYKAIAEATINALENYLEINGVFYLEGLDKTHLAGREVFVAVIGFSYDNKEDALTGSSILTADENESVVKAVLAAVNRRINAIG